MKILLLIIALLLFPFTVDAAVVTADHTAVDSFDSIPANWIDSVQANLKLFYVRQSHGGRMIQGMSMLVDEDDGEIDTTYFPPEAVYSWWPYGDCGTEEMGWNGDTCFVGVVEDTMAVLTGIDINVVSVSWCAAVFTVSATEARKWVSGWKRLATTHDTIDFIIQTSRLWDPQSQDSATYQPAHVTSNQYLRDAVADSCSDITNIFLYDFADIEWYDRLDAMAIDSSSSDSGHTWPKRYWDTASATPPTANTQAPTYGGTWDYLPGNSGPETCAHCYGGSWDAYLCSLHGRAWWYLMARIAGWDGETAAQEQPAIETTIRGNVKVASGVKL